MPRFLPFRRRAADSKPADRPQASAPLLTLQERRLLLGILFLFALGLVGRGLQLRAERASQPYPESTHPQPGATP